MTMSGCAADDHPDRKDISDQNGCPEVTKPAAHDQTKRPVGKADAMAPAKRPHTAPAGAGRGNDAGRRVVAAATEVPRASQSALIGGGSRAKETAVARAETNDGEIGYYRGAWWLRFVSGAAWI